MFIRSDLEKAIKNKFGLEKFVYKGTGKNTFNDFDLLMFDTDKGTIAIELGFYKNYYYIYKIKELPKQPELFFRVRTDISSLYTFDDQTYLKVNDDITEFPGKAFDFTQELVLLALENET